jgi:hypothetical protein
MLNTELTEINHKSQLQLRQESLIRMLEEQYSDRSLFHLVLTYKPYQDKTYNKKPINTYTEQSANRFFTKFYLRYFLPYLFGHKNYHHQCKRQYQPICLSFIDEHEPLPIRSYVHNDLTHVKYSERLHHHAILAVHQDHLLQINQLIGTNTLVGKFSYMIMTSFIRPCDADTLKYASKMMMKYQDFLTFPDRMSEQLIY